MPVIALVLAAVILISIVVLVIFLVRLEVRQKSQRRRQAAPIAAAPAPVQTAPAQNPSPQSAPAAATLPSPLSSPPPSPSPLLSPSPPPVDPLPTTAYLQLNAPGQPPQRFPLAAAVITLGRDPACTIPVAEALAPVSRRHAQIERDGDDYILTDLGSENGLFVDGVRAGRNLLRDGAVISLAQVVSFTFHAHHRNQP